MRYLFYTSCAFFKQGVAVLSDEAERIYQEGNEVYFLFCDRIINVCSGNICSNEGLCKTCKLWTKLNLSKLSKGINLVSLNSYYSKSETKEWNYSNVEELKSVIYKKTNIGLAVLSTYISKTRNQNPLIDLGSKPFFDNMLSQASQLVDAIERVIGVLHPDCFILYNGRLVETRGILDYMITNHIETRVMEVVHDVDSGQAYKVQYDNCLPHNILANQRIYEDVWNHSRLPKEKKIEIAKSFYENRRYKKKSGDKIYTASQRMGQLPADFDKTKRNLVIFNSSEDEFAAVGGEYEALSLFKSQQEGIRYILNIYQNNDNVHFYLRIHPNLKDVNYKYHTDLYNLPKEYSNITVIGASENIDTYSLMDNADTVLVFNSTIGIESVYWKKPVILLRASMYYYSDICYVPKTKEELKILLEQKLKPKFNDFVYKYGFKIMAAKEATIEPQMYNYFDWTPYKIKVFGKTATGVNYQTLFGSKKLLLYLFSIMRVFFNMLYRDNYSIPTKEA